MSIVITPIPSTIELAAPAFQLGTTNIAGGAVTAVASNSTLLTFDASNPSAVAASPSVGTATVSSRRDHAHSGSTLAQGAKCWLAYNQVTSSILASENVASVTDGGAGDFTVVFTTEFGSVNYSAVATTDESVSGSPMNIGIQGGSRAAANCSFATRDNSGTLVDLTMNCVAMFGAQ